MKQSEFLKTQWDHRYSHGGILRQTRAGRKSRPLSTKRSIHLVLKANKEAVRGGLRIHQRFALIQKLIEKYAKHFYVKIAKISIQGDHIHLLIRAFKRSKYADFFRVVAGQIAQQFQKHGLLTIPEKRSVTDTPKFNAPNAKKLQKKVTKLWMLRPFTRVVTGGRRAYRTVMNYIQLNEQEAKGVIPYRKERLRGLKPEEWRILWS